ncbi:SufS family cysteine desulfurase [Candidatus Schneideria nysicola]|uniref:SufS family cysteine desulfurase n=1 Tax=Candidatus Schneideria nysicola TaxID=1081631 RepID=UPI001CAA581F|nr:SufS family cysteine desulfurase [Candidatus Schneideria nysicola]UAJ65817.1 SufS family cysteine desulfurase [Candidatus Schneideria nysicola]
MRYPIDMIRSDFPILSRTINNYPLVYLDNAASTQKPNIVIDSESHYYRFEYAAVHRGIYTLSNESTSRIEEIRSKVAKFINAASMYEIIFCKGATEGINLIANSLGKYFLQEGDNILLTEMEHHSNIVPWQILAREKKLILRFIPVNSNGMLDFSTFSSLIDEKTRILAITHLSNVLGVLNPINTLIKEISQSYNNILFVVDGAQYISHSRIDVQKLGCDFYVFSGHKIYGPSGIGIVYGKKKLLDNMPPWQGGGAMIRNVSLRDYPHFTEAPWKFEAGSPNTAGIIGLGAALDYIQKVGLSNIIEWEQILMEYLWDAIETIPNIKIYGPRERKGILSFNIAQHHPYDVGIFLDQYGIAIRTGHHCAMPLMNRFKTSSMCRVSLALYNTKEDIDKLLDGLRRVHRLLS